MLGFEHPSHMVTHPSTDEAQCCLTLEISKNYLGRRRKKEYEKQGLEVAVTLVTRRLKNVNDLQDFTTIYLLHIHWRQTGLKRGGAEFETYLVKFETYLVNSRLISNTRLRDQKNSRCS